MAAPCRNVDVSLTVEPTLACFPATGGTSEHNIINTGTQRLAIKLRCSNNAVYRMNPVTCFLETGKAQKVTITRLVGAPRIDKVVVQYCEAGPRVTDVKEKFKSLGNDKIDNVKIMLRVGEPSREVAKPSDKADGTSPQP